MAERVTIVVPGDDPQQITGSANLERLASHGDVVVYDTRPATAEEKIERVKDAEIIINSRGAVTWREAELRALPNLRMARRNRRPSARLWRAATFARYKASCRSGRSPE